MPVAVNSSADDWHPYWSADRTKMLFQSTRDGDAEIYVWDSPTATVTQLTNNRVEDSYGSWSPPLADGKARIVFQRRKGSSQDLWVMNADGTGQRLLFGTRNDDFHAKWSPLGDQIAFVNSSDGDEDIYLLNVTLSKGVVSGSGTPRNITGHSGASEAEPDWAPSGLELVFVRGSAPINQVSANSSIWRMKTDGTGETLVIDHLWFDRKPDWSPDGTTIAFSSGNDGTSTAGSDWDIWTVDVNGGTLTRITDDDFHDGGPEWRNAPPA
jgi:TolB protein